MQRVRAPTQTTTVWPGDYLEVNLPASPSSEEVVAIEPRCDMRVQDWPPPMFTEVVDGQIRLAKFNSLDQPIILRKNEDICQTLPTKQPTAQIPETTPAVHMATHSAAPNGSHFLDDVVLDPDDIMPAPHQRRVHRSFT